MLFFGVQTTYSQDNQRVLGSKLFVKSYFRLPNATSNRFYKKVSRGISDAGLSVNYKISSGLNVGVGFRHSFFEISQFKISEKLDAQTHLIIPYGELSYIKHFTDKVFLDVGLQLGKYTMRSSSNPCRSSGKGIHINSDFFISPNASIYLKGAERLSYSFSLGYAFTQTSYTPATVCLEEFNDFKQSDYVGTLQYFTVGFGVMISIGKIKAEN